jgi:hypothetical protein
MGKDVLFNFNAAYKESFNELRLTLTSALILCYYILKLETIVKTDASNRVIAGILS